MPKQPVLSAYRLMKGEYQVQQFWGDNCITLSAFPELNLTAERVFSSGI